MRSTEVFLIWTIVSFTLGMVFGMNIVIAIEKIVRWATKNYSFNVGG